MCANYPHVVLCARRFFFLKDLRSEMIIIHFGNEGSKISILLSLPGISKICTHSFSQQTKE